MGGERRNLELKARDPDPGRSLQTCGQLGAKDGGLLPQRDTYFEVSRGRLKLRREGDGVARLIAYERPDSLQERESRYRIVTVTDADELEAALAGALGVAAVVAKSRRLFLYEGVRIHLDEVDGLGNFIELEGVAAGEVEDASGFAPLLSELRGAFGIADDDLVAASYCDLVRATAEPESLF